MALEPTPDPLERARVAARTTEPEGWVALSEAIMGRVRSVVVPAEPVLLPAPDGAPGQHADGSRTFVSTRVLTAGLRRVLQGRPTHAPHRIELRVQDARLVEVRLEVVAAYGVALHPLGDAVRDDVRTALATWVGVAARDVPVTVVVVDVVVGDPNLV